MKTIGLTFPETAVNNPVSVPATAEPAPDNAPEPDPADGKAKAKK